MTLTSKGLQMLATFWATSNWASIESMPTGTREDASAVGGLSGHFAVSRVTSVALISGRPPARSQSLEKDSSY